MTMADVLTVVFILFGFALAMPSVWLLFGALWPNVVSRAQERSHRSPFKSFFLGIAVAALLSIVTALLGAANLPVLSAIAFGLSVGFSLLGVSGLARHVGTRLPASIDASSPWRSHLRGCVVLELAFLFPVLGWMLILPIALILGCGTATFAIFSRKPTAVSQPARESIEVMA
jgi:hypothetical protein